MTLQNDMAMQAASLCQNDMLTNQAVGANVTVGSDEGLGVNDCSGVDHWGRYPVRLQVTQRSINMKVTLASLTTSPSTVHLPFALPILPRALVISTSIIRMSPGRTGLRHFTSSADMK